MFRWALAILGAVALTTVVGCGGSTVTGAGPDGVPSASVGPQSLDTGGFAVRVHWPETTAELVPAGSTSVVFSITDTTSGDALATRVLTRSSPTTVVSGLRAGTECTLTATAHPEQDGSGVAQAVAIEQRVVPASTVESVALVMGSTITSVVVSPSASTIPWEWGSPAGGTQTLSAVAKNADGATVLVPTSNWSWAVADGDDAVVSASGSVTVMAAGSVVVTATESESGVSGSSTVTAEEAPPTGQVSGTVYSADGTTPISGAVVYVPSDQEQAVAAPVGVRGTPPEDYYVSVDSSATGGFLFDAIPEGTWLFKIRKGLWHSAFLVTVIADQETVVSAADSTLTAPNIALVTGAADSLEDVLAKLGLGDTDSYGGLVLGTEEFDIYDGGTGLPSSYPVVDDLVTDEELLNSYDIVFFPCLADEGPLGTASVVSNIRDFVAAGGRLYVTCWAQEWAEIPFPNEINTDQVGLFDTLDGVVLDENMKDWLVAQGAMDATDDSVPIEDSWAVINSISAGATVYVDGNQPGYGDRPFTVTIPYEDGVILYTVYHTVEWSTSPDMLPQEQILAYLVFEL